MKRPFTALVVVVTLIVGSAATALADGHGLDGVSVTVDNTIESVAFDFPEETPFGSQGPVVVGDGVELPTCCDDFYAVDLSDDQISMRWIGDNSFARVIEDGTFDRYYFTFDQPVLAGASLAADSTLAAKLTVVSATELVVEVGPGLEVGEGFDAIINVTLAEPSPNELAVTGVETWQFAVIGVTAVGAGVTIMRFNNNRNLAAARITR